MSCAEESQLETDGEEIQNIGYETVSEVSSVKHVSVNNSTQNRDYREKRDDDEVKDIGSLSKERIAKELAEDGALSSSSSSNNDICRICHMGNSASYQNCLLSGEHGARDADRIGNRSSSANLDLGLLVSACRCRGTVGLVHTKCLERWLTESGHKRCELCGYRYATIRVPRHGLLRSLAVWFRTFVATRQVLIDMCPTRAHYALHLAHAAYALLYRLIIQRQ